MRFSLNCVFSTCAHSKKNNDSPSKPYHFFYADMYKISYLQSPATVLSIKQSKVYLLRLECASESVSYSNRNTQNVLSLINKTLGIN